MINPQIFVERLQDHLTINSGNITVSEHVAPNTPTQSTRDKEYAGSCYVSVSILEALTDRQMEAPASMSCMYDQTVHFSYLVSLSAPIDYLPDLWAEVQAALADWQIESSKLELLPLQYIQGKLMNLSTTAYLWHDEFKLTLTDLRLN